MQCQKCIFDYAAECAQILLAFKKIILVMKKNYLWILVALILMSTTSVMAQMNKPKSMRMEVAEAETDKGEYTIFTYIDSDDTFGYYLSLVRESDFLGADEILGMEVKNVSETTIWLGATADEAFVTIDNIMALYDKDLETTAEFKGRGAKNGAHLGDENIVKCMVVKKTLGGKRLEFFFPQGNRTAHAYLTKQVLKELRSELKISKKLQPKLHR